ncbi:putative membrane protein [Abditibacterium utsteinense]|uniref:Putative membrane protein n=1 Tax=Abditibacterium utsteinense TaxID=1960156 RepID=A0A2S8SR84_9BACT|nr:DMT family transporter [Abditibacterium utsteinense]PQV63288.1 putative membrane protein [Abditibacterium utsteinense]
MGILFGLLSAIFWGAGDYLIAQLTRHTGTVRALLSIQFFSLVAWIGCLLVSQQHFSTNPNFWGLAVMAGVCHVVGLLLTYRAFEIGTLSLVSPIASGFAIVTALIALANGERPPLLALAGTGLLILGVVCATYTHNAEEKKSLVGVPEALGSALAFGIMFWLFDRVQIHLGVLWPLVVLKSMAFLSALISVLASKKRGDSTKNEGETERTQPEPLNSSPGQLLALALGAAALDTLAWLAYNAGVRTQFVAVVTALASLFSVVTLLMAWVLLKDRLSRNQWTGIALILAGILMVSL